MSSAQLTEKSVPSASSLHDSLQGSEPGKGSPEPRKESPLRTILVVLVILCVVGAIVWKIRSNAAILQNTSVRSGADAAGRAAPVLIASVEQKTMPIYLSALGTVTPYYAVTIKSRVDGQLLAVPVREGQAVRKGQLLAEIDPSPYQATVAQAEGQLAKDQAAANYAKTESQRYQDLFAAGVVSKDSAQTQESTAGQAAGAIAADQAAIQAAKVNLAYTKISSPIDGVVGLRQVDPGNIVHASDATGLLLVTQLQPISVIFTLPEDQLPEVLKLVRAGKKLTVEAYDRSNSQHLGTGTVLTLDNQIDPTTGTDKVKAVFPNKDGALFPNQFVNVRLILQQRPNAVVVPAAAIQTGSDGNFVYLVKKGDPPAGLGGTGGGGGGGHRGSGATASGDAATPAAGSPAAGGPGGNAAGGPARRAKVDPYYVLTQPVKVDVTEGTQVILTSGVNPGDKVVIDGQERLVNGSRVTPRTSDGASPAGTGDSRPHTGTGNSAAFGPGTSGPSEPGSHPNREGIETGHGIPASGNDSHRRQGAAPQP